MTILHHSSTLEDTHTKANIVAAIILNMRMTRLTTAETSPILQVNSTIMRSLIPGNFMKRQ